MSELFIKTKDESTKNELVKVGFRLIGSKDGVFTFMNSQHLHFSDELKGKIVYSNLLCV